MDDKTLSDLFGSLSREIGLLRQDVKDVKDGVERVESRLTRQGASSTADPARWHA